MQVIFLGGDLRQKFACETLKSKGIDCEAYLDFTLDSHINEVICKSEVVAFPLPILKNEKHLNILGGSLVDIYDIISILNERHIVFGGNFSSTIKSFLSSKKVRYVDYFDDEPFQIKNALLSAQGAIYYTQGRLDSSISGLNIAILGFGRIGKILVYLLYLQGAKITVYARRESDFAWCRLIGLNAVKINNLGDRSNIVFSNNEFDVIFNTIPNRILNESFNEIVNCKTMIIDLASYPYGIDDVVVKKYNLKYFRESGIPGKFAPKSAGTIIGETILNNIYSMED